MTTTNTMPDTVLIVDDERYGSEAAAFRNWAGMIENFVYMWPEDEENLRRLEDMPSNESGIYRAALVQNVENGAIYVANGDRYYTVYNNWDNYGSAEAHTTHRPAEISIDNGTNYYSADELFENEWFLKNENYFWTLLVASMDDDVRKHVNDEIGICTNLEFLRAYCAEAEDDICIG